MTGKQKRKGDGRVAFFANTDKFRELLNNGHPQRSIYEDHAAALGISYSQFNRYVTLYITKGVKNETPTTKSEVPVSQSANPPAKTPAPAPVPQKVEPAKQEKPAEKSGAESAPRKGPVFVAPKPKKPFIYDPTKIDIKDLI